MVNVYIKKPQIDCLLIFFYLYFSGEDHTLQGGKMVLVKIIVFLPTNLSPNRLCLIRTTNALMRLIL